jgi:hypothetical protein
MAHIVAESLAINRVCSVLGVSVFLHVVYQQGISYIYTIHNNKRDPDDDTNIVDRM